MVSQNPNELGKVEAGESQAILFDDSLVSRGQPALPFFLDFLNQ